jgi:hypothetical protein
MPVQAISCLTCEYKIRIKNSKLRKSYFMACYMANALTPTGMVYDDLPWPLLTLGKLRIPFWGGDTDRSDSIDYEDVSRVGLQFNMGSEQWWGPSIVHFPKVSFIFSDGGSFSLWAEKPAYRSDWGQTQNTLNGSPLSYPETSVYPYLLYKLSVYSILSGWDYHYITVHLKPA